MKKILIILLAALSCNSLPIKAASMRYATFNIRCINQDDDTNGVGWNVRKDSLARFILDKDFDIVGMQEVVYSALQDLQKRLPEYDCIGVGRDDGVHKGEHQSIFYKRDKYELLDQGNFWLSETPDVPSKGWDGACVRVATWGKFRDKKSGKIFMSINTHFDHVGKKARNESSLLIIKKIKDIVGDKPAIVTGDFNTTDESECYKTITTNEFVLRDAYKICNKRQGPTYSFHGYGKTPDEKRAKIDFIFITPNITPKKVYIAPAFHYFYMSDHCPHWADLTF